jgi:eukaryotic-like serine/threonine-protein kinase
MRDGSVDAARGLSLGTSVDLADRPTRIGPYRILGTLGKGGMGVVYLAEQLEPVHREVAVKVLRTADDSDLVVARFNTERQALAVMDHPNITKVFDAGITENGWPYFVMERVDGVPLTEYAAAHRLELRERVRLFIQICRAVQHAHQKGIIHRDLKPSNILVTHGDEAPLCKVIDFGIARAVERPADGPHLTQTGLSLGTPAYMSPEQAFGSVLDVDTRTDIYALGVVLYELLAGVLPFDPETYRGLALLAQHATKEAPAPSARVGALPPEEQSRLAAQRAVDPVTLRRHLVGELDWIVARAMEKERERRYETAAGFALDLERYLANEPVLAGRPSRAYRARKFVRRHRVGVAFAATVVVLLVGFSGATTVQARRIARARAVAEARQGQAEDLIGFMLGDLRTKLTTIGRLDVLDDVGKKSAAYFAAVPETELSDEELFRRSQALRQLGDVRVDQGNLAAAMEAYRQSLTLAKELPARDSTNGEWQVGLGASHFGVGFIHWRQGNFDGALSEFVPYLRITEALVAREPDSLGYRLELSYAHSNIGSVREAKGDLAGALDAFRSSLAIKQGLVRRDSTKLDWRLDLAQTYNSVGVVQRKIGDLRGATASHRAELALKQSLARGDSTNRAWQRQAAIGHAYLGSVLLASGGVDEALAELRAARAIYAALSTTDPSNAERRRSLANSELNLGLALLERGDPAAALAELEASRGRLEQLLTKSPDNRQWQQELARTQTVLAQALLARGRAADAAAAAARRHDSARLRSPGSRATSISGGC